MDEPRDPPAARTDRAPLAAGISRLSPVQEAWGVFTRHSLQCDDCRDPDQKCATAGQLWRRWQQISGAACDRIADAGR